MRPLKKLKNIRKELHQFLLNYRSTPHRITRIPPSQLVFDRTIRAKTPHLPESPTPVNKHKNLAEKEGKIKEKSKKYYDKRNHTRKSEIMVGDQVLVRQQKKNSLTIRYNTTPYTVKEMKGSKVIDQNDKHQMTINISFFEIFKGTAYVNNKSDDGRSEDELVVQDNQEGLQPRFRYPVRDREMPNFYGTVITH